MAALAVSLLMAVALSLAVQPGSLVTASFRAATLCDELVDNGGFETEGAGWEIPPGSLAPPAYTAATSHSGSRSMHLGIPAGWSDRVSYSTIYQGITIPSDAAAVNLAFWYKPYTEEWAGDFQRISLLDGPPPSAELESFVNAHSNSGAWTEYTTDLSDYAGQTVYLYFTVYNDGDGVQTWMYVDDVSVEYCREVEPTPTGTPPTAKLGFDPPSQAVFVHTAYFTFTADVVITEVTDLAGFEFDVVYDPEVVQLVDVVLGDYLGGSGREVVSGGGPSEDGRWNFWAASGGDEPTPSDATGILATTFLSPIASGETALTLENVQLANTQPVTMPFTATDGQVVVSCFGDADGSGGVDVLDILTIAKHWYCECDDECYEALYDVDGDCQIRAADMMLVAVNWGPCESAASAYLRGAGTANATNPTVKIDPDETGVLVGGTFSVTIGISDAHDLGLFQFDLRFDPELLRVDRVMLGEFLASTGREPWHEVVHPQDGVVRLDAFSLPPGTGPDGQGDLAHVSLIALDSGESDLHLENVRLMDTQAVDQVPTVLGARVKAPGAEIYLPLVVRE